MEERNLFSRNCANWYLFEIGNFRVLPFRLKFHLSGCKMRLLTGPGAILYEWLWLSDRAAVRMLVWTLMSAQWLRIRPLKIISIYQDKLRPSAKKLLWVPLSNECRG